MVEPPPPPPSDDAKKESVQRPPKRASPAQRTMHATRRPVEAGWMLTYMDLVTLLVTLFVLLLSYSTIDPAKYAAVARGLSLDKHGTSILVGEIYPRRQEIPVPAAPSAPAVPAEEENSLPSDAEALAENLNARLAQRGLQGMVQLTVDKGTIDLQINEDVLFPVGSAELTALGLSVARRLADSLAASDAGISVEGHTDNVPIRTDRFPSNWELSAARAAAVARAFVDGGILPERLHIRGYADTKPVAPNETDEGRQRNRRVNLILKIERKTD